MATWDDIKKDVEENGNILTVTMEVLREAHGVSKLGPHVRNKIEKTLAGMGLGHVPQELPNYQHEQVRLYKRGTLVGDLIETVLNPGEKKDKILIERFSDETPDYVSIIEQIRDLVTE